MTIAIDAMGGDFGPTVTVPAALRSLQAHDHLSLILTGDMTVLQDELAKHNALNNPRIHIEHASEVVKMDESPVSALRSKKDSSMRVALNCVKEQEAHACVSAGNTGALMVIALFVLKTLEGVARPAIISRFPT
ncbi:MAG: phosphate acyltransferase, partial [Coxiellaceae bacterium]|nr:phosphate acyltransferase [Coxiellaceae bacterium]